MYGGCRQVHLMNDDNGGNQEDQVQVLHCNWSDDAMLRAGWFSRHKKNFSGNATEEESHSHAHHYHHVDHTVSLSVAD